MRRRGSSCPMRARAISAIAAAVTAGPKLLCVGCSLEDAIARLRALQGVGESTTQYIALRGMHELDAFPAAEVGHMRARPTRRAYVRMRSTCWRVQKRGVPGAFMPRNTCGPPLRQRPRRQPDLARDKVEGECAASTWWSALASTNTSSMLLRFRGGILSPRGPQQSL
jgi:hypothetical protein